MLNTIVVECRFTPYAQNDLSERERKGVCGEGDGYVCYQLPPLRVCLKNVCAKSVKCGFPKEDFNNLTGFMNRKRIIFSTKRIP